MKYSPFVWLALGAATLWFFFGRRVTATVSIGDGVSVAQGGTRWQQVDPLTADEDARAAMRFGNP
jgi:hypothetical protein